MASQLNNLLVGCKDKNGSSVAKYFLLANPTSCTGYLCPTPIIPIEKPWEQAWGITLPLIGLVQICKLASTYWWWILFKIVQEVSWLDFTDGKLRKSKFFYKGSVTFLYILRVLLQWLLWLDCQTVQVTYSHTLKRATIRLLLGLFFKTIQQIEKGVCCAFMDE